LFSFDGTLTAASTVALAADMLDLHRLHRMVAQGLVAPSAPPPARVMPRKR